MSQACRTFQVRLGASDPRTLARRLPALPSGGFGLVFLTLPEAELTRAALEELAASTPGTWIVARSDGAWTEQGELSSDTNAAGMVLPPARYRLHAGPDLAEELLAELRAERGETALVLLSEDEDATRFASDLTRAKESPLPPLFGCRAQGRIAAVSEGRVLRPDALALVFPRHFPVRVASSTACRLISPIVRVTRAEGRALMELDEIPALEMLQQIALRPEEADLLLLAVAPEERALSPQGRVIIARPIVGVDPGRGALIVDPELPVGARVAIAVRDRGAARSDLDRHLQTLGSAARTDAPLFGFFFASAARRRPPIALDSEVRKVAHRFPSVPLLGLSSSAELSPFDGKLAAHTYASVLALFSAVN